jgi:hypothetical protein
VPIVAGLREHDQWYGIRGKNCGGMHKKAGLKTKNYIRNRTTLLNSISQGGPVTDAIVYLLDLRDSGEGNYIRQVTH